MLQGISGKKSLLLRFQDGCKNHWTLNQLIIVIVEKRPVEEEYEVPMNPEIPEEQVTS